MEFRWLSKYFPPPKYLNPPHSGISFSDSAIRAIYFDKSSKAPSLKSVEVELEKGAIVDGIIAKMEEVVKKLSILKEDIGSPLAFFAVPDELAYVFSTAVVIGPHSNAAESVAFIMEENVPLPLGEISFDFIPTGVRKNGSEHEAEVVVAACVKKEAMRFVEALRQAGFEPLGCIHESQAIANAVIPKSFSGAAAIIHAREKRVGIYLVKGHTVRFSTLRSVAGGDYVTQLLDEYRKFSDYNAKPNAAESGPIEKVFVCGEFECVKITVGALIEKAKETKDVKLSNVWTNVFEVDKHLPNISYEKSLGFAGPVGAVLSDIV